MEERYRSAFASLAQKDAQLDQMRVLLSNKQRELDEEKNERMQLGSEFKRLGETVKLLEEASKSRAKERQAQKVKSEAMKNQILSLQQQVQNYSKKEKEMEKFINENKKEKQNLIENMDKMQKLMKDMEEKHNDAQRRWTSDYQAAMDGQNRLKAISEDKEHVINNLLKKVNENSQVFDGRDIEKDKLKQQLSEKTEEGISIQLKLSATEEFCSIVEEQVLDLKSKLENDKKTIIEIQANSEASMKLHSEKQNELKEIINKFELENSDLKKSMAEMEGERKEMERMKEEAMDLKVKLSQMEKNAALEKETSTKVSETMQEEKKEVERLLNEVKKEKDDKTKLCDDLIKEKKVLIDMVDELKKEKDDVKKMVDEYEEKNEKMMKLYEEMEKEDDEKLILIEKMKIEKEDCVLMVEKLKKDNEDTMKMYEIQKMEKEEGEVKYELLLKEKEEKEKWFDVLKTEKEGGMKIVKEIEKQKEDLAKLYEVLNKKMEEGEEITIELKKEKEAMEKQLQMIKNENEEEKKTVIGLSLLNEELRKNIHETMQERDDALNMMERMKKEKEEGREKAKKSMDESEQVRKVMEKMMIEKEESFKTINKLKKEKEDVLKVMEKRKTEFDSQDEEIERMKVEKKEVMEKMKIENVEVMNIMENMKKEKEEMNEMIENLKMEMDEKEKEGKKEKMNLINDVNNENSKFNSLKSFFLNLIFEINEENNNDGGSEANEVSELLKNDVQMKKFVHENQDLMKVKSDIDKLKEIKNENKKLNDELIIEKGKLFSYQMEKENILKNKEKEIEDANMMIKSMKEENDGLYSQLSERKIKIESMEKEITNLNQSMDGEMKRLTEKVSRGEEMISKMEEEKRDASITLDELKKKVEEMNHHSFILSNQQEEERKKEEKLIEKYSKMIKEKEKEMKRMEGEFELFRSMFEKKEKMYEEELEKKAAMELSLKQEIYGLEKEVKDTNEKRIKFENEFTRLNQIYEEEKRMREEEMNLKIKEVEKGGEDKAMASEWAVGQLATEISKFQYKFQLKQREVSLLQEEVSGLEVEVDKRERQLKNAIAHLGKASQKLESMKENMKNLQSKLSDESQTALTVSKYSSDTVKVNETERINENMEIFSKDGEVKGSELVNGDSEKSMSVESQTRSTSLSETVDYEKIENVTERRMSSDKVKDDVDVLELDKNDEHLNLWMLKTEIERLTMERNEKLQILAMDEKEIAHYKQLNEDAKRGREEEKEEEGIELREMEGVVTEMLKSMDDMKNAILIHENKSLSLQQTLHEIIKVANEHSDHSLTEDDVCLNDSSMHADFIRMIYDKKDQMIVDLKEQLIAVELKEKENVNRMQVDVEKLMNAEAVVKEAIDSISAELREERKKMMEMKQVIHSVMDKLCINLTAEVGGEGMKNIENIQTFILSKLDEMMLTSICEYEKSIQIQKTLTETEFKFQKSTEELVEVNGRYGMMKSINHELRTKIKQLKSSILHYQLDNDTKENEIKNLTSEMRSTQVKTDSQLNSFKSQLYFVKDQVNGLKTRLQIKESEKREVLNELSSLQEKYEEIAFAAKENDEKMEKMKDKFDAESKLFNTEKENMISYINELNENEILLIQNVLCLSETNALLTDELNESEEASRKETEKRKQFEFKMVESNEVNEKVNEELKSLYESHSLEMSELKSHFSGRERDFKYELECMKDERNKFILLCIEYGIEFGNLKKVNGELKEESSKAANEEMEVRKKMEEEKVQFDKEMKSLHSKLEFSENIMEESVKREKFLESTINQMMKAKEPTVVKEKREHEHEHACENENEHNHEGVEVDHDGERKGMEVNLSLDSFEFKIEKMEKFEKIEAFKDEMNDEDDMRNASDIRDSFDSKRSYDDDDHFIHDNVKFNNAKRVEMLEGVVKKWKLWEKKAREEVKSLKEELELRMKMLEDARKDREKTQVREAKLKQEISKLREEVVENSKIVCMQSTEEEKLRREVDNMMISFSSKEDEFKSLRERISNGDEVLRKVVTNHRTEKQNLLSRINDLESKLKLKPIRNVHLYNPSQILSKSLDDNILTREVQEEIQEEGEDANAMDEKLEMDDFDTSELEIGRERMNCYEESKKKDEEATIHIQQKKQIDALLWAVQSKAETVMELEKKVNDLHNTIINMKEKMNKNENENRIEYRIENVNKNADANMKDDECVKENEFEPLNQSCMMRLSMDTIVSYNFCNSNDSVTTVKARRHSIHSSLNISDITSKKKNSGYAFEGKRLEFESENFTKMYKNFDKISNSPITPRLSSSCKLHPFQFTNAADSAKSNKSILATNKVKLARSQASNADILQSQNDDRVIANSNTRLNTADSSDMVMTMMENDVNYLKACVHELQIELSNANSAVVVWQSDAHNSSVEIMELRRKLTEVQQMALQNVRFGSSEDYAFSGRGNYEQLDCAEMVQVGKMEVEMYVQKCYALLRENMDLKKKLEVTQKLLKVKGSNLKSNLLAIDQTNHQSSAKHSRIERSNDQEGQKENSIQNFQLDKKSKLTLPLAISKRLDDSFVDVSGSKNGQSQLESSQLNEIRPIRSPLNTLSMN